MNRWCCELEKVNNGYICTTHEEDECGEDCACKNVFEGDDIYDDEDPQSFVSLIWHIAEYYGVLGSKHLEKRFFVGMVDQETFSTLIDK